MDKKIRIISVVCLLSALVIFGLYRLVEHYSQAPTWRGITPGKSTREDVIEALGEPKEILEDPTTFFYEDESLDPILFPARHEVIFKDNVVWLIISDQSPPDLEGRYPVVEDLIAQYGQPEDVLWARVNAHERVLLFCHKGVFAIGRSSAVFWISYFDPITTTKCIEQFDAYMAVNNPAPRTDFKMIRDPWGFTMPANLPDSILYIWPRPEHELPLSAYNDYITYRAPEHGVGVWISLGLASELGMDGLAYEGYIKERAVLLLNGQEIPNDVLWITSVAPLFKPEDEARFMLSWDAALVPGAYEAKFTYKDHFKEKHTYTWRFSIGEK